MRPRVPYGVEVSARGPGPGFDPPAMALDAIAARRAALEADEEEWAGAILIEPLTALAGGILGGTVVSVVAWRLAWAHRRRAALLDAARAILR